MTRIPVGTALRLKAHGNLATFIETGTYLGATMLWAAGVFEYVVTIEKAPDLYVHADNLVKAQKLDHVLVCLGDSREVLPGLIKGLAPAVPMMPSHPVMFWLDAHWSGGKTTGYGDECPLMGELEAIVASDTLHYILIDDARIFLRKPNDDGQDMTKWPKFLDICALLEKRGYCVRVGVGSAGDVIYAIPESAVVELER